MKQRHRKHRRPVRPPYVEIGLRRRLRRVAAMAEKYRPYVWAIKRRLPAATVRFNEYDAGRIVEVCINCGAGDRFISVHAPMQPSLISTIVAIAVDRSAEPA
jgi:hypothetical protein